VREYGKLRFGRENLQRYQRENELSSGVFFLPIEQVCSNLRARIQ
jgi:hypothetical protein